jgi:hypothetical protein
MPEVLLMNSHNNEGNDISRLMQLPPSMNGLSDHGNRGDAIVSWPIPPGASTLDSIDLGKL